MQIFEIDVCGEDLLKGDYSICVASKNGKITKGFRLEHSFAKVLNSKWGQGMYRYYKSQKGKTNLKIRIYSVIIYFIFKEINPKGPIALNICRDFDGQEAYIREMLKYFLEKRLRLNVEGRFYFCKLPGNSFAHKGAYELNRKISKNNIEIFLENLELYLK